MGVLVLKTGLLLYMMQVALPTVNAECSEIFDSTICVYTMTCENIVNMRHNWDYYRPENNYLSTENCNEYVTTQNGYQMIPIHLNFKENHLAVHDDSDNEVPTAQIYNGQETIFNSITSIDLSNNNFFFHPTLRRMAHLVVLNLSRNEYYSATFSNKNELPNLKKIDLSHNYINRVYLNHEREYIYENLEEINLSYNNLMQVPAMVFGSFINLTNLDLSHNSIDTLSQITFEGMKKLAHLNMSHNSLTNINASLFRFSELRTLDLSNNKLNCMKTGDLNSLTKLEILNLQSNFITSVDKEVFQNLHALYCLDLSDNTLELLDKDVLKNVDKIKVIIIANNKFKTLPKGLFKNKSIRSFSVIGNNLEGSVERGTFDGLQLVSELDLSNQRLEMIGDNAFYGMELLKILLLQKNNIKTLSTKCFNMLQRLEQLDLSFNKIMNIEFEKESLGNLESLSIRNNFLSVVRHEHFKGLDSLQALDLSDNKISQLESNSFNSLKNLISFEISNNPLNGTLEENTFDGLTSLPSLDISCTLLSIIQNGSFNGMTQLKTLNISRSEIEILEYNSFNHTGSIEVLDLSHNKIKEFNINNTHLSDLFVLYLNNNHIKTLHLQTFNYMSMMTRLILSNNEIETIHTLTFLNQQDLRVLDVSFDPNLVFSLSLINSTTKLDELLISGIKTGMSFANVQDIPLSHVELASANIGDVKALQLNGLKHLDNLVLSHNKISKLEYGCFTNLSTLEQLDLSFNRITYIQPGTLKDNTLLNSLNVSHNFLKSLTYGIFRGLSNLQTLDISYNSIESIQNKRFHELRKLSLLIADHNKIKSVDVEDFLGTNLLTLSIGDNPIPCDILVKFNQSKTPFQLTAIKLDEHIDANLHGITCNNNENIPLLGNSSIQGDNAKILISIREILLNQFKDNNYETPKKDEEYLANITRLLSNIGDEKGKQVSNIDALTSQIINNSNETNVMLEKILKLLTLSSLRKPSTPAPISKDNATYENLLNYVNKLKQQLDDTINYEKNIILNEVDTKISAVNSRFNSIKPEPVHEKLSAVQFESKDVFTETCIALILVILVALVLFKVYKSGIFRRKRLSISTRQLPDAMESPL